MNKKLSKYSQTLYNISDKNNDINIIQNELNTILHLYKKVPSFRFIIITKRVSYDKKINILKNTLQHFSPLVTEFLSLIIKDRCAKNLLAIISSYNKLAYAKLKIKEVDLIVSHELESDYIEKLISTLSDVLKTTPKINVINKPDIIGGIKLKIGNKVFDNSVSYQLNKLKKTLYNM